MPGASVPLSVWAPGEVVGFPNHSILHSYTWVVGGNPLRAGNVTCPSYSTDLEKVVDPGNLVPRKYLGCRKIFSPNPALWLKIKSCVANRALLDLCMKEKL